MSQMKLKKAHTHTPARLHTQIASCNRFTWWVNYLGKYWICLSDYFARGANTHKRTMHAACLSFSVIFHSNWCLQVCGCEFRSQSVSSSLESGFRQKPSPPPFFFPASRAGAPSKHAHWLASGKDRVSHCELVVKDGVGGRGACTYLRVCVCVGVFEGCHRGKDTVIKR